MFNDNDRITVFHNPLQYLQKLFHIMGMQTGCRLIQYKQGFTGCFSLQLACQLDTLRFTAGQGGCTLSQLDVAQTDILQRLQLMFNFMHIGEKVNRFLHAHFQNIINIFSLVGYLQGFFIVALAAAFLAWDIDIRQKVHGYAQDAISLTGFTAPALHIEGEASLFIAAHLCFRGLCIQITNIVKYAGIGRRITPRCSSDWIL